MYTPVRSNDRSCVLAATAPILNGCGCDSNRAHVSIARWYWWNLGGTQEGKNKPWYRYDRMTFSAAFVAGGVNDGPEMYHPSEQEPPQHCSEDELHSSHEDSALDQLAETWYEEAADGSDDVAGRTLSWHCHSIRAV